MGVCREAISGVPMRETDGTSLPCSVDGHLGDRRDGDVPDRGAVLLFRRRHERGRGGPADGLGLKRGDNASR